MSTSSSTTTAEELIAESITMNDAKDVFLKSIERLSSDDRLTQKAMAKALGLNRTTFSRYVKKYDVKINDYKAKKTKAQKKRKDTFLKSIVLSSIPTGTTAASFMKVIERLPSEDRLSRTTMIKALPLSSATFYRKVKEYGIKLNDFVVDKKRKRVEEKEQKVSQCNTN